MSEKESESSGFRVVDKRRFDDSGKTREGAAGYPEAEKTERAPSGSPQGSSQSASSGLYSGSSTGAAAARSQKPPVEQKPQRAAPRGGSAQVDFSSLVMSLATQALVMMGEIPSQDGMPAARNLEGAQQTVDIIALLAEKTKGNLTPDEDRLMEEVLAQLRLAFVNSVGK